MPQEPIKFFGKKEKKYTEEDLQLFYLQGLADAIHAPRTKAQIHTTSFQKRLIQFKITGGFK